MPWPARRDPPRAERPHRSCPRSARTGDRSPTTSEAAPGRRRPGRRFGRPRPRPGTGPWAPSQGNRPGLVAPVQDDCRAPVRTFPGLSRTTARLRIGPFQNDCPAPDRALPALPTRAKSRLPTTATRARSRLPTTATRARSRLPRTRAWHRVRALPLQGRSQDGAGADGFAPRPRGIRRPNSTPVVYADGGIQSGSPSVRRSHSAGGAPAFPAASTPPTMAQVVSTSPPTCAVAQNACS
jgi:hypothetical protein